MSTSTLPAPRRDCLLMHGVDWETYTRLLRALAERPAVRLTYDRGELEIMTPLLEHDTDDRFLARLVVTLTEELGLELVPGGSTTLRRRKHHRGLEPDDCFWIENQHRMRGKRRLNLRSDPPPDLVIEVDVTRSSLDRMGMYAKLGVPEVWRLDDPRTLMFNVLGSNGKYAEATHSRAFPFVTPADLLAFLQMRSHLGDNAIVRQFREWIRPRMASGGAAPSGST